VAGGGGGGAGGGGGGGGGAGGGGGGWGGGGARWGAVGCCGVQWGRVRLWLSCKQAAGFARGRSGPPENRPLLPRPLRGPGPHPIPHLSAM
jgi:hypothetical protein